MAVAVIVVAGAGVAKVAAESGGTWWAGVSAAVSKLPWRAAESQAVGRWQCLIFSYLPVRLLATPQGVCGGCGQWRHCQGNSGA